MTELEDKLQLALANVENAKLMILNMKESETDDLKNSMLTNYNLELLDLKLRLKDMLRNIIEELS